MVASGELLVIDSGTAGPNLPDCNNVLGSITLVVGPEGEYGDGGTICGTSSGIVPDLGVFENPWINTTME